MRRPVLLVSTPPPRRHGGYTLIEMLLATVLTLMLVFGVATVFSDISKSVNDSRSTLETLEQLRGAAARLKKDLEGATVVPLPPQQPENGTGYLEIIEGVRMVNTGGGGGVLPSVVAFDKKGTTDASDDVADTTVGDFDDILMLTTRSNDRSFVGRYYLKRSDGTEVRSVESNVAEVAWFMRGRTLYRRMLLIHPLPDDIDLVAAGTQSAPTLGFYADYDISARQQSGVMVANTLGDLARREFRYAHHPTAAPYSVAGWQSHGLPTLAECSLSSWNAGAQAPGGLAWIPYDFWRDSATWCFDPANPSNPATPGSRANEDVILTNVIGFDIKVWDPGAPVMSGGVIPGDNGYAPVPASASTIDFGAYADLGYCPTMIVNSSCPTPRFQHKGFRLDGNVSTEADLIRRTYDTWSTHYERNGIDDDDSGSPTDEGVDGFDNDGNGLVDDVGGSLTYNGSNQVTGIDKGERETTPPYPAPLRGIQIKIRVFEPDSRQIREVTVVQQFVPQ
jgi:type II secretory pathway pseudopilin PulG